MGGKSTPKAPNYKAAAEEQAESSMYNTRFQTFANRPNQYTPFGSSEWVSTPFTDPVTGKMMEQWTQNVNLDPDAQAALDAQQALGMERSQLGLDLFDRAAGEFGPMTDWSSFQGYGAPGETVGTGDRYVQEAEDAFYNQWSNRMEPQLEQQRNAMDTQLRNQGLAPGDEAYDYQMNQMMNQQADARSQAQYQATQMAGQEAARMHGMASTDFGQRMQLGNYQNQIRQQQIAEEMQRRGWTLNEINAILTGQQVGMPNMPNFSQAQRAETAQYLQAAGMQHQANMDIFGAQQAQDQMLMQGVTGLAGAAFGMPSDIRLKTNIRRIGRVRGRNFYTWDWVVPTDLPTAGVIAQENPDISAMGPDGFLRVDYRRI